MRIARALVVDDDSTLRMSLFKALEKKNFQVITASRQEEAKSLVQSETPLDLAVIDLNLPDGDGIELMTFIKTLHPQCEVLILTGFGTIESAIRATQKGAFHFVTKPFNLDELLTLVDRSLNQRKLEQENDQLRTELQKKYHFEQIIGQSDSIKAVLDLVCRVADSDATILVSGESGTGKELIARAIHYNSPRARKAFVAINCGAIPSELLESELFGHVKGAFTGAIQNRVGRFELADGGTLFLDEIGDLEPALQVKLLRVLQEKVYEPVGGTKSLQTNVRVITATNKNLEELVKQSQFREDLFYRLNVIPIQVPALRDRKSDIPLLLAHFIDVMNKTKGRKLAGISPQAVEHLQIYPWPGNIRELENLIERISILKGAGRIEVSDLPPKYLIQGPMILKVENISESLPEDGLDFNTAVDQFENALILRALEKTGWNRNQAAILLRLNRTTLVEKIKKKGLRPANDKHDRHDDPDRDDPEHDDLNGTEVFN